MFSVIVPVYNKRNCISRTIFSILAQTFRKFELLIIDDGSTDDSVKVISAIKDDRIRLFQKPNEGVSIARNYGVSHSNFDYIVFLDADDEWPSNFLEAMYDAICTFPQYKFFSCPFVTIYKNKAVSYRIKSQQKGVFVIDDYCSTFLKNKHAVCCVGTVCVYKELLIESGMFPPHIKKGEDHDLWLRLACKGKIVYTNQTNLYYYIDTENNSRSTYNSYQDSFPYWKWYDYPYFNKKQLFLFTTYFLISHAVSAIKRGKIKSALVMLSKIRIF